VCRASANLPDFFSVQKLGSVRITHQKAAETCAPRIVVGIVTVRIIIGNRSASQANNSLLPILRILGQYPGGNGLSTLSTS